MWNSLLLKYKVCLKLMSKKYTLRPAKSEQTLVSGLNSHWILMRETEEQPMSILVTSNFLGKCEE